MAAVNYANQVIKKIFYAAFLIYFVRLRVGNPEPGLNKGTQVRHIMRVGFGEKLTEPCSDNIICMCVTVSF